MRTVSGLNFFPADADNYFGFYYFMRWKGLKRLA